ncbi:hypothetical protein ACP4OV_001944 [Aristida adscensionis]
MMPSSSSEPPPPPSSAMTTSWISDAWRNFTSVRAWQHTGTHLLYIDGYSVANRIVLPGESIDSPTFRAGGHKWKLSYFPNGTAADGGRRPSSAPGGGHVAVDLTLMDSRGREDGVTAAYRVSILGRDGIPAYSYAAVGPQRFTWSSPESRVEVLVTAEERAAALRLVGEDDILTVRCEVTVTRFDKESRLKWYLRQLLD